MAFFFSIIIKVFYFLKKGVSSDLHIIGRDSSSLAQGAGYLHIRIQKRGGDDSLKPSLLRIKSSVSLSLSLSLSLSVCTHRYSSNATIFFSPFFPRCIKSDMRYFSHMTPDRIHPSTSVGWTFLFHCFFSTRFRSTQTGGIQYGRNQSKSIPKFRFFFQQIV